MGNTITQEFTTVYEAYENLKVQPRFTVDTFECFCDRVFFAYDDHERVTIMRKDMENFTARDINYIEGLGLDFEITTEFVACLYLDCDDRSVKELREEEERNKYI